jgi:hypothetical protein
MFDMLMNSIKLFFAGRLFRDGRAAAQQWLKGFGVTLAVMLVVGLAVSPLAGVVVASLVGGIVQPLLFKDLKYA